MMAAGLGVTQGLRVGTATTVAEGALHICAFARKEKLGSAILEVINQERKYRVEVWVIGKGLWKPEAPRGEEGRGLREELYELESPVPIPLQWSSAGSEGECSSCGSGNRKNARRSGGRRDPLGLLPEVLGLLPGLVPQTLPIDAGQCPSNASMEMSSPR